MMPEVPHVVSADESLQVAHLAVKQLSHIATLPEVTLGIIELVEDPNSSAQDLNALIGRDPALSARVLKVVNSAFYGLPRQIGSINRAISLLGLNAVKNIAIASTRKNSGRTRSRWQPHQNCSRKKRVKVLAMKRFSPGLCTTSA